MVALSRAVGRKPAMEMLLTGDLVDAGSAARSASSTGSCRAPNSTRRRRPRPPDRRQISGAVAIGKETFYRQAELGLDAAYAYTAR